MEKEKGEFPIQLYSIKEMAKFYRVSPKTFMRYIRLLKVDLGTRLGNSFSPKQVRIIVDNLGKPLTWFFALVMKAMFGADDDGDDGKEDGQKLESKIKS